MGDTGDSMPGAGSDGWPSESMSGPSGAAGLPNRGVPGERGCPETLHTRYEFLDGEMTEEVQLAVRAHLDDCPPCIDVFDFEIVLRRVVSTRCQDDPPDHLLDTIRALLRSDSDGSGGISTS